MSKLQPSVQTRAEQGAKCVLTAEALHQLYPSCPDCAGQGYLYHGGQRAHLGTDNKIPCPQCLRYFKASVQRRLALLTPSPVHSSSYKR